MQQFFKSTIDIYTKVEALHKVADKDQNERSKKEEPGKEKNAIQIIMLPDL